MSLINKFKSLLPISSRSFHAAENHFVTQNNLVKDELFDIKLKQDELFRRIEQADNGINENINAKYDAIDASLRTEAERKRASYVRARCALQKGKSPLLDIVRLIDRRTITKRVHPLG